MLKQVIRQVVRTMRRTRVAKSEPRCMRMQARSEQEVRTAAIRLAGDGPAGHIEPLIRELVELNTPALFLNIVDPGVRVSVMLRPSALRSIRFRGRSWFLDAGSDAPEGIEAFMNAPFSHVTTLYPTAPDHPVYVMSIEHQGERVYTGDAPEWLTHVTIVVNGRVIARAERLLRERGMQVWAA